MKKTNYYDAWVDEARRRDARWLIVAYDDNHMGGDSFPVYGMKDDDIHQMVNRLGANFEVTCVYDLSKPLEPQLANRHHRADFKEQP